MRPSLEEIALLIQTIKRDRLLIDGALNENTKRLPILYSGYKAECLLRIHVLPYLIPIKSYRHLAFEVAERPELQKITGLEGSKTPTRATLWHFRRKHSASFSRLLARSLALVSAQAWKENILLNFTAQCPENIESFDEFDNFKDLITKTDIMIYLKSSPSKGTGVHDSLFYSHNKRQQNEKRTKINLHEELSLPILVRLKRDNETVALCVNQPSWTHAPEDLGTLFGKAGKTAYVACNMIVLDKNDKNKILLSERLVGSGKGEFSLPGGKKRDDESITDCVARELKEEVGIEFRAGEKVSEQITNEPGFPQVTSIGVVVTKWEGEPKKKEPWAHKKWEWYSIQNLPSPLFFPTQFVLDDYLAEKSPWGPLEDDLPLFTYGSSQNEKTQP